MKNIMVNIPWTRSMTKQQIHDAVISDMILGHNHRMIRKIDLWPKYAEVVQRKNGLVILHGAGKYIITVDYDYYRRGNEKA